MHNDPSETILHAERAGEIVLYRRNGPNIYYRLRVTGEANFYERKSTRTASLEEAKLIAQKRHAELLGRQRSGLSVKVPSFEEAAMNWLNTLPYRVQVGKLSALRERLARDAVTKRLIPYFKGHDINELTPPVIRRFHAQQRKVALEAVKAGSKRVNEIRNGRRVSWSTMPRLYTPSAEEMMNSWIRQIFKQAVDDDLLHQREVPHLPTIKHERKKRGTLTKEQWGKLIGHMVRTYKLVDDVRVKFHRTMFMEYVVFMSCSGLRVGEARQLKWGHISTFETEDGRKHISLRIAAGKTGKRVCVPQPIVMAVLERIRAMHPDPSPQNNVFVDWKGRPNGSFHTTWSRMVRELGIDKDVEGQPITLYSLRHYYITERLCVGVDIYLLAKNCGTSVKQIEQTYSHVIPLTVARELTKVEKLTEDQEYRLENLDDNQSDDF